MKLITTAVLAAALTGAATIAVPTTATADEAGRSANSCVDRGEYRKADRGTSKSKVARIFDTNGRQTMTYTIGGARYEDREYKTCTSRYGFVSVSFKNGKVTDKFAYWG